VGKLRLVSTSLPSVVRNVRRHPHARALARSVPGLSRAYHATRRTAIRARGVATLDYPGAPIRIRASTQEIVRSRLTPYAKEPWTVDWIDRNIAAGDVLYDIGANVGVYSLIAAKASRGAASVVAFEPAFANYAALCENIVLNAAGDSVTPLPVLLGESTRLGSLGYSGTNAGTALHVLDGDGMHTQASLVYALDELVETFGLPAPTLLKLDVDGAEGAVLAGAHKSLRRPELRSLVVEVDSGSTDEVLRQLGDAGLQLTQRIDERDGRPLPGIWYGVFDRA
jgi:FkbM family methyltransferase